MQMMQMQMNMQMQMQMKMMETQSNNFVAAIKSTKRKRDEEEEEDCKSLPILIDVENHHLKDDAHTVLDMAARALRPYNGGDLTAYWAKRPRKAEPVIMDIRMSHMTKAPVNPSAVAKLHDRGAETNARHWLSSNYSVKDNDRKIRASDKSTAGSFYYDFSEPGGVWEAVDAVHNYTMALRLVREDDWSGTVLLRVLHECRMFAHPRLTPKIQRELIMGLFNQVSWLETPDWGDMMWFLTMVSSRC